MRKRCIALVLCLLSLLTLAGCRGDSIPKVKTITAHGVECYRTDGVCYPAVFGEPQLTEEELTALLDGGDPVEMAMAVNTVPDALRLLRLRKQSSKDIDNQDAETTLLRGGSQPFGWVEAFLYLLAGDCEESGRIDLFASDNYYAFAAVKQDGLYYAFDPFQLEDDSWIPFSGLHYADADVQSIVDELVVKCRYDAARPFARGQYIAATYQLPSKEAREQLKIFKQREYTDEEIQQLANAGLTLEEAADKLHTAEDAALFLQASGYHFDYTYNQGSHFDGIDWSWVLPAEFAYEKMAGSCGGTSNLMNRLLAGDYDEQGYVQYLGGHIFNYIKQGGWYYFCDFTNCGYLSEETAADYMMYTCQDPHDFLDYYCNNVFTKWDDPADENYMVYMYHYPRDGKNALALGGDGTNGDLTNGRTCNVVCAEVQDTLIELYVREGYSLRFVDFDSDGNRPPTDNIPDDAHFDWRTGEIIE